MNKKELKQKCADLGIDTQGLDTNAQLEEAIQAKETQLAAEAEKVEAKKVEAEKAEAEKVAAEKAEAEKSAAEKVEAEKAEAEKAKAEKAAAEKAQAKKAAAKKAEEKPVPVYKDSRGRKWSFKAKAPGTLNIGGHPMTQEEILNSEEVITELVYGNSSYLTQID